MSSQRQLSNGSKVSRSAVITYAHIKNSAFPVKSPAWQSDGGEARQTGRTNRERIIYYEAGVSVILLGNRNKKAPYRGRTDKGLSMIKQKPEVFPGEGTKTLWHLITA